MIRIKEAGREPVLRVWCKECGAYLEFHQIDVLHNVIDDEYYLRCPACGHMNQIEPPNQLNKAR